MSSTGQNSDDPALVPPTPELVREELNRILADPRFVRSERHSSFLRYTVNRTLAGAGGELKEYTIAAEVYGKSSSYDPSTDSIVRVEAGRLRSKILAYYATSGREDPVRIDFPKGTYTPVFITQAPATPPRAPEVLATKPQSAQPPLPRSLSRRPVVAGAAVIASLVALLGWWMLAVRPRSIADTGSATAVLSFVTFSPDAESEAFAAGLTKDVSAGLSHADVRVADRDSTLPFRTGVDSVLAIGQKLHVATVLDGSVRKEGDALRVTAQLIDTADGYRRWSETYERKSRDAGTQAELSRLITRSVLAERSRRLADETARTPAANEARRISRPLLISMDRGERDHLLMHGGDRRHQMTLDAVMAAVHGFERAIALDPGYSPAYGGLALAYLLAADFDERLFEKVRETAVRGLEIDEKLAEAHFALGYHLFLKEWDFAGAERELKRTLELNSRDVTAGRLYADCSALLGDPESGVAALGRVQQLIPNSPVIAIQVGIMLYHARRFHELEEYARSLRPLHPGVALVPWLIGLALEQQGRYAEAASEFGKTLEISPDDARATPALGHVYGRLGRREDALKLIAESRDSMVRGGNSGPVGIALIYLGLGDRESALTWLETAYNTREGALPYIRLDPRCDPLRTDPRFLTLLRKLHL